MIGSAHAQFLPQLQAKTPGEFDAYLDVVESPAERRIEAARGFLSAYPQSGMRLRVFELLAEACRQVSDAKCALEAAAGGLKLAADYLPLLTLRASVEANTSPRPDPDAAERALALLGQVKAPKTIDAATWLRETTRLRAENLASLGIVAFKRSSLPDAIRRFEESVAAQPIPANRYRLAMLYVESKRLPDARRLLHELTADPNLRDRAVSALRALPSQ